MTEIKPADVERLIRHAVESRDHAYAPHSHFYVGAAVMTISGEMIAGCNVENASYSLCVCAERNAAATAIANGYRDMIAVAIASVGGVSPCGACRQFLAEFNPRMTVICVNVINNARKVRKLNELLPDAFDGASLPAQ